MSTHKQSPRLEEITLRMLGDNITLTREQWRELAAMLAPSDRYESRDATELAARIHERIKR
jgi:hypothetical protein